MIRVLGTDEDETRRLVDMLQGAGGEKAQAGLPSGGEEMPSIIVADGIESVESATRTMALWQTPFLPLIGVVGSREEGQLAWQAGVSEVVFRPTSRKEMRFRAESLLANSVYRLGDAVTARHLIRSMLAWSKRYDTPLSFILMAPAGEDTEIPHRTVLDLLINMRLSDHLCRVSYGALLIILPETSAENAKTAAKRLIEGLEDDIESNLTVTVTGGRVGHLSPEEIMQRL
ncbi:hypothetical protein GF402_10975 [Candidatus Fermentibacteria bacterium]|nr:hypothetical protein [Candidatus Fermentibacteria bacterium]